MEGLRGGAGGWGGGALAVRAQRAWRFPERDGGGVPGWRPAPRPQGLREGRLEWMGGPAGAGPGS